MSAFSQGLACRPQTKRGDHAGGSNTLLPLHQHNSCTALSTESSWRLQPNCCLLLLLLWMLQGSRHPRSLPGTVYRQNPRKPTLPSVTPPPASNDLFHCSTTGNPLRLKTAHTEQLCLMEAMICVFSCTTCPQLCGHRSLCASPYPAIPLHNNQTQTFLFAVPKGAANCDTSSSSHQETSRTISLLLGVGVWEEPPALLLTIGQAQQPQQHLGTQNRRGHHYVEL